MIDNCLGDRISALRKYLRISQSLIGKEIFGGKSRQYVASIENNERSPSTQELKFLAILFRLPEFDVSFLKDKIKYEQVCNFKLSSELNKISRRGKENTFDGKELKSFSNEIDEKCVDSHLLINNSIIDLLDTPLPFKLKIPKIRDLLKQKLDFEILEDNLFLLPEKLGIYLKFTALSTLSGACVKTTKNNYGILINSNQIFSRQRFNLMHELGHFFLGHNEKKSRIETPLGRNYDSSEIDADSFAAEMLMPSDYIVKEIIKAGKNYKSAKSIYHLSQKMSVSYSAMLIRLKNLEFLNSNEMNELSKASLSNLTEEKVCKDDPESSDLARKLVSEELETTNLKSDLSKQVNSPNQLRNFQEGVFSKLREKLSARLVYEVVAIDLFNKVINELRP